MNRTDAAIVAARAALADARADLELWRPRVCRVVNADRDGRGRVCGAVASVAVIAEAIVCDCRGQLTVNVCGRCEGKTLLCGRHAAPVDVVAVLPLPVPPVGGGRAG